MANNAKAAIILIPASDNSKPTSCKCGLIRLRVIQNMIAKKKITKTLTSVELILPNLCNSF